VIIDTHVYTNRYSHEVDISPSELIPLAQGKGLQGIVLVEKNRLWKPEDIEALRKESGDPDFVILRGQEIDIPEGKLVAYGVGEELHDSASYQEVVKKVHSLGGAIVFSPFVREGRAGNSEEDLFSLFSSFDGVEIFSSALSPGDSRRYLDMYRKAGFSALGGSWAFQADSAFTYASKFSVPIKTERDLARAIRMSRVRPCVIDGNNVDPAGGNREKIRWTIPRGELMDCEGLLFDLYGTLVNLRSFESMDEFSKTALWLNLEGISVSGEGLYNFYIKRANELYQRAIEKLTFPEVDILRVFRDALHYFSGTDRGEDFARRVALVFRSLTIRSIKPYPHTRSVLRELKRRGYRMGIVSNAQAAFTVAEIEDLKLEDYFDFVILSSDVGCSKPERRIFEIAITHIELPVEKIVMIGDDLHGDIFAGKRAGLKTVHVRSDVDTSPYPVEADATLLDGDLRNLLRLFP
jgi:putative hydrolase of the HAD superfamily